MSNLAKAVAEYNKAIHSGPISIFEQQTHICETLPKSESALKNILLDLFSADELETLKHAIETI